MDRSALVKATARWAALSLSLNAVWEAAPGVLARILFATLFGLGYTAFSEYHSVYLVNNWAYSALMPTVFGLGVSPLLQWLLLPSVSLAGLGFLCDIELHQHSATALA